MPGSKNKGGGKKKSRPVKKSAARKKSQASRQAVVSGGVGRGPLYAIAVLVAIISIIALANKHDSVKKYFDGLSKRTAGTGEVSRQSKDPVKKADKSIEPKHGVITEKQAKPNKLTVPVKVYFLTMNERTEKVTLYPVTRNVTAEEPLANALKEMLKGPSTSEKRKGVLSAMPDGLVMRGVSTKDGIATVDFNGSFEENAIGTILMNRIEQIVYTATQFNEIRGVIITINGRRKSAIGPDGIVLSAPLTRQHH